MGCSVWTQVNTVSYVCVSVHVITHVGGLRPSRTVYITQHTTSGGVCASASGRKETNNNSNKYKIQEINLSV